jgi:hypothetical protein
MDGAMGIVSIIILYILYSIWRNVTEDSFYDKEGRRK